MAYATREDYESLYEQSIGELRFARLIGEAEQAMDRATTGVDLVRKLRSAFPREAGDADAVKRCACALVDILRQVEDIEAAAGKAAAAAREMVERTDGTVTGRVVTAVTAGSESVTFAAPGTSQSGFTALEAAAGDRTARERLLAETAREYLSGAADANGVHLLYMGRYPAKAGADHV